MAPTSRRVANMQTGSSGALPPYQRPLAPLDQNALSQIQNMHRLKGFSALKQSISTSVASVSNMAADLAEQQVKIEKNHEKRKEIFEKRRCAVQANPDSEEVLDEGAEHRREEKTHKYTRQTNQLGEKLEAIVRESIDRQDRVDVALEKCKAMNNELTRLQRAREAGSRRRDNDGDIDMDAQRIDGPSELLRRELDTWKSENRAKSLAARYATHNDYISYKNMVHSGKHGNNAPPVPHPSTWFGDQDVSDGNDALDGAHSPHTQPGGADQDQDSDIEIARATNTLTCPITMKIFEHPVRTKKCTHSFESMAILGMIKQSTIRINATDASIDTTHTGAAVPADNQGDLAVRCPNPGCEVLICEKDLEENPVLQRQAARKKRDEERRGGYDTTSDVEEEGIDDRITIGDDEDEAEFRSVGASSVRKPRSSAKAIKLKQERATPRATPGRR